MEPPMAIIWRCLSFNFMLRAGSTGGWSLRGFPSESTASVTILALGLRLKLSFILVHLDPEMGSASP
jgi:hypothetical protein